MYAKPSVRLLTCAVLLASTCACDRPTVPLAGPAAQVVAPAPSASVPVAAPVVEVVGFTTVATTTPLSAVTTCNFETIDGKPFTDAPIAVSAGSDFKIAGYLYDAQSKSVPADLRVRAIAADGSAFDAPVPGRVERQDVPSYFKIGDWALHSGFDTLLPGASLAPGEYRLVLTYAQGGQLYACDNGRRMVVGP